MVLLGGDFNACLSDDLRHNYARTGRGFHPDISRADQLYRESITTEWFQRRAWTGMFQEGAISWEGPGGRAARLDEVFVLSEQPASYTLQAVESPSHLDHWGVVAHVRCEAPRFRTSAPWADVVKVDKAKWRESKVSWALEVDERCAPKRQGAQRHLPLGCEQPGSSRPRDGCGDIGWQRYLRPW